MTIQNQLAGTIKKIFSNRKDVEIPALLGDKSGTIKADNNGNVYVTFWNGETIIVRNQSVANQRHWVIVGYRNNVLQVLRSWDVFSDASFPDVPEHDHTWGKSTNPSWIRKEQFLDGLALPGTGLTVDFYGCWFQLDNVVHVIPNQTIDLTAQIPSSDARWCNVEVDADSVITFNTGSSKANRELLLPEDIPGTSSTKKLLFSVKTYEGQTRFIKEVADTDFFDPRFTGMGGGLASAVDWADVENKPATFAPDLTITDPRYPRIYTKLVAPAVSDDSGDGYKIGDLWIDTIGLVAYQAIDVSVGAAVWYSGASSGGSIDLNLRIDGALAVATNVYTFLVTKDMTVDFWYIHCDDPGTASSTIFDVHKNGTTVFTTQSNRPILAWNDANGWAKSGTPDITTFVEGDIITIDIDQIATGAEGLNGVGQVTSTGGSGSANPTFRDESSSVSVTNVGEVVVPDGMLVDNGGGSVTLSSLVVQEVYTLYTTKSTGTTTIPYDDTIPQNTEGTEFITLSITPKSATNLLKIEVILNCSISGVMNAIAALFQDSGASAIAAGQVSNPGSGYIEQIKFTHWMTAGTISATTFKLRAGPTAAATITINGSLGNRYLGGVAVSSMTITEIKA